MAVSSGAGGGRAAAHFDAAAWESDDVVAPGSGVDVPDACVPSEYQPSGDGRWQDVVSSLQDPVDKELCGLSHRYSNSFKKVGRRGARVVFGATNPVVSAAFYAAAPRGVSLLLSYPSDFPVHPVEVRVLSDTEGAGALAPELVALLEDRLRSQTAAWTHRELHQGRRLLAWLDRDIGNILRDASDPSSGRAVPLPDADDLDDDAALAAVIAAEAAAAEEAAATARGARDEDPPARPPARSGAGGPPVAAGAAAGGGAGAGAGAGAGGGAGGAREVRFGGEEVDGGLDADTGVAIASSGPWPCPRCFVEVPQGLVVCAKCGYSLVLRSELGAVPLALRGGAHLASPEEEEDDWVDVGREAGDGAGADEGDGTRDARPASAKLDAGDLHAKALPPLVVDESGDVDHSPAGDHTLLDRINRIARGRVETLLDLPCPRCTFINERTSFGARCAACDLVLVAPTSARASEDDAVLERLLALDLISRQVGSRALFLEGQLAGRRSDLGGLELAEETVPRDIVHSLRHVGELCTAIHVALDNVECPPDSDARARKRDLNRRVDNVLQHLRAAAGPHLDV